MVTRLLRVLGKFVQTTSRSVDDTRALLHACTPDEIGQIVSELRLNPPSSLMLEHAVLAGIKPSEIVRAYGNPKVNPFIWSDAYLRPISAAHLFMSMGDRDEALVLLDMRTAYGKAESQRYHGNYHRYTWVLPPLLIPGVGPLDMGEFDSLYEAGAFSVSSVIKHRLERASDPTTFKTLLESGKHNPGLRKAVQDHAIKIAERQLISDKKGGFRYGDMAALIRFASPGAVDQLMSRVGGSRLVAGAFYPGSTPEVYLRGLMQLAQMAETQQAELLPHLARGPTVEEYKKIKGVGAVTMLHWMNWEHAKVLVAVPEIRAKLLAYVGVLSPDYLRLVIVDHNKRVSVTTDLPNVEMPLVEWEEASAVLQKEFEAAKAFKPLLLEQTGDPLISWMFLFQYFQSYPSLHLKEILGMHPNIRGIKRLLADYRPALGKVRNGYRTRDSVFAQEVK